jgi:hypothetical protein
VGRAGETEGGGGKGGGDGKDGEEDKCRSHFGVWSGERERGTKCMKNRKEMEREEARLDDNFRELWLVSQLRREILAVDRFAKLRCVV